MYCIKCGGVLPESLKCPHCGYDCGRLLAARKDSVASAQKRKSDRRRWALACAILAGLFLLKGICALFPLPLRRAAPPWWLACGVLPAAICFLLCALLALAALALSWRTQKTPKPTS